MTREQLQQIRDALEHWHEIETASGSVIDYTDELDILDAELAKPEQEPVARPDEQTRRNLVSECGLEWDDGSETSSNDPFAWATFDGEGSYDLRLYECNEDYRAEYIKRNGDKYAAWVIPLYTSPAPAPQDQDAKDAARWRFLTQQMDESEVDYLFCFDASDWAGRVDAAMQQEQKP